MPKAEKEFILNYAMNRWKLNSKNNVGPTSDSIRFCRPTSLEEWRNYYYTNVRNEIHIDKLGEQLYRHIKEELPFSSQTITKTLAMASRRADNKMRGIMGGKAGKFIIDEFLRGAVGNMPACEIADVHVKIWALCENGDIAAAQALLDLVQPLLNFESVYGAYCYKEVLRRRGVIPAAYTRTLDMPRLDDHDIRELDRIMEQITPAFSVT